LFDNPHEADLKAAIRKLPLSNRTYMVRQMLAYIGQFRGYSWLKPILSASARRLFLGRFCGPSGARTGGGLGAGGCGLFWALRLGAWGLTLQGGFWTSGWGVGGLAFQG